MKRTMAVVVMFTEKSKKISQPKGGIKVEDTQAVENVIIRMLQLRHFKDDIDVLRKGGGKDNNGISKACKLKHLSMLHPFIDDCGILRVGGRLKNSPYDTNLTFPVILPKKTVIIQRLIEWFHERVGHSGRSTITNEIRSNGYWIINMNTCVRSVIYHCVKC